MPLLDCRPDCVSDIRQLQHYRMRTGVELTDDTQHFDGDSRAHPMVGPRVLRHQADLDAEAEGEEGRPAMTETLKRRLRCAVYTRKSTDEGMDQEYNSIDAQRDAGHAYIASQRAEGWIPVTDDYDDPAYSGGHMERPTIKSLLADIDAGKIDVVVVYKIDRLTRSLADFSKMVEVFERRGVSFVSVTQQFNTTTSMGRLMLNVLLSFAQFEREVTGERIRDKFAASKRKGIWMGGIPPLGYLVKSRRLVPNEAEAKLVRHIFRRFVELGSGTLLVKELTLDGATSKSWTTQDDRVRDGKPIDKTLIYKLIHNRTYLGELKHRDEWVQGEHPAIISRDVWGEVHTILATNGRVRGNTTRATVPQLLKGLVFGSDGRAMSPHHVIKPNGRRYRYYVPQRDAKEHAGASGQRRACRGCRPRSWSRRCWTSCARRCGRRRCWPTYCLVHVSWIRRWTRPRSPSPCCGSMRYRTSSSRPSRRGSSS